MIEPQPLGIGVPRGVGQRGRGERKPGERKPHERSRSGSDTGPVADEPLEDEIRVNAPSLSVVAIARLLTILTFLGSVALVGLAAWTSQQVRRHLAEVEPLAALQQRADDLSLAADALLVGTGDETSFQAFLSQLRLFRAELSEMEDAGPSARRALVALDEMAALASASFEGPSRLQQVAQGPTLGVLGVPAAAAATMTRMAELGVTVESAVADLLLERRVEAETTVVQVARALGGSAALFAFLSVVASWFLYRRLGRPAAELASVVDRVGLGDTAARADVRGRDEMALLGTAMNAMLDRRVTVAQTLNVQQQELQRHATMLRESQRIGRIGSWRRTVDTDQFVVSAETLRILGLAPDAAQPTLVQVREMIHADDVERFEALSAVVTGGGGPAYDTLRLRSAQGGVRHVHIGGDVERDEGGHPMYVAGVIQDVTERVEARAALDEQRRVMEIAGRIARFGGWYVDTRTQALTWSDRVCEIHEVPLGTRPVVGEGIAFYAPEHRARIRALFERAVRDGVPYDEELQIVTAAGRRIWVRTTGEAVRDDSGRIIGLQGAFQDIDDRKRAELQVHHLDQRLRTTLERLNDGFVLIDDALRITFANTAAVRIAGRGRDTPVAGKALEAVLPGVMTCRIGDEIRRAMRDGVSIRFEDFDPTTNRWLEIWADPTQEGLAVGLRDVTGRRDMVERLRRQEAEVARELATREDLIDSLPANIAVLDGVGVITSVNGRWREFARDNGAPDCDCVGVSYLAVCDGATGDDAAIGAHVAAGLRDVLAGRRPSFAYEYPCHSPSEERWFRVAATPLRSDDGPDGAVVMHVDISERKRAELALERIAFQDPFTGYLSRDGLTRELATYLDQGAWPERAVLVTLDLVELRGVNEAQGFAIGDALLAAVGDRLAATAGPGGLVARTGGDAFAVFLPDLASGTSLSMELFGSRDGSFAEPFIIDGFELDVATHYGYTRLGAEPRPVDGLLREAEVALNASRFGSSTNGRAYTSELDRAARARVQLAYELREALKNDEFELHFQPKVDLASGCLVAGETLIRWNHPVRGLLSPGAFIPVAEKSRLIVPIGRWVLDRACRTLRAWQDDGMDIVQISVNVSVEQLADTEFLAHVEEILTRHRVPPSSLTLEITESVFADEGARLRDKLDALHALGVKLSLDDFGTGYSSLAYLKNYPFDYIKIDRAFVQGLPNDSYSRDIVASVLKIASSTGATVIAEGIELSGQRDALLDLGCSLGQGYHYSVPLSEEDFAWLLAKRGSLPLKAT